MKPKHIKEQRLKEIRRLQKRQREIWKLQRELGDIEIEKPIRHGWYKEIVITHRIERFKNKTAILELYNKIERYYWGRTKEEAENKWVNQTSKYLIYKGLPTISKKQFNKLSFNAQCMCTAFQFRNESKKLKVRFYIRIPKGAYRIKNSRAYITHRKRIDPALISEEDLIRSQFIKKGYHNIYEGMDPWKDDWNLTTYKQDKLKTKRHLKALKKYALKDVIKENISWENH
ncbi:hypothetical protein [Winogradskyella psychrotolerans]|uniref:hypothetical protein n=1 Tax=Winogradskyella psychrotolerans TaxID=1344585 RepID=UPI001C0744F9|nr:hypothetical protein [Winogradskyella psychrotolerans]MBU2926619.1 hypothetical protein [Winogradskyella psychrotolerans]